MRKRREIFHKNNYLDMLIAKKIVDREGGNVIEKNDEFVVIEW